MKTTACPECGRELRPCNLARHMRTHYPVPVKTSWGTRWLPAKRPIARRSGRDRLYDEVVTRGVGPHRFRLYRLRAGVLDLLGSAPGANTMGIGLYELDREGEFITDDATGVLDTIDDPAHWLVHPFALGRRPREEGT